MPRITGTDPTNKRISLQVLPYVAVSAGTSEADLQKLKVHRGRTGGDAHKHSGFFCRGCSEPPWQDILSKCPVKMICLDIANGYSEHFVATVRKVSCTLHIARYLVASATAKTVEPSV